MIVKDVKIHVRTSRIPPTDSLGGSGLGGTTAAIEDLWRYWRNKYAQVVIPRKRMLEFGYWWAWNLWRGKDINWGDARMALIRIPSRGDVYRHPHHGRAANSSLPCSNPAHGVGLGLPEPLFACPALGRCKTLTLLG